MVVSIPGSGGPYSKRKQLQFQIRCLKGEIENKPMGPRTRKQKEKTLLCLQSQLRELNKTIRESK